MVRNSEEIASHECADGACHAPSVEHNVESAEAFPRVHDDDDSAGNLCPQAKSADDTFHASATATALCSTNELAVNPRIGEASGRKQNTPRPSAQLLFSSLGFVENVTWTHNLFSWFAGGAERTHRYAAYVCGTGGEGKTRIVRAMIRGMNVFECKLTEPYAFHGFSSSTDVVLVDEVNWSCFDDSLRSTLLTIMARQPAVILRKFKKQETVVNEHVLTIFTSNFKLVADETFRRRIYLVWAKVRACNDCISPKDDDPGDDDTLFKSPLLPSVEARAAMNAKR